MVFDSGKWRKAQPPEERQNRGEGKSTTKIKKKREIKREEKEERRRKVHTQQSERAYSVGGKRIRIMSHPNAVPCNRLD